ncbi:MAG: hypothetical protein O9262_08840, partial [Cyclobacteriaceae bacterium]|nr:hypothetical protein [Cyclobacteriaceae bacterium]
MVRQHAVLFLIIFLGACTKEETTSRRIEFKKRDKPIWEGVFTAADPSVVRDGDTLRMYYSSLLVSPTEKLLIAGAKSVDGINWIPSNNIEEKESVALDINANAWDNHLEAVTV